MSRSKGVAIWIALIIGAVVAFFLTVAAKSQTVTSGQKIIAYSASMTFDPTFISNGMTMNGNVTSFTIPNGAYGGQVFHLSACQGTGGPYTVSGAPTNVVGQTGPLNPTGCTYFRMVWDVPSTKWITSIIGQNPLGLMPVYGATGSPLSTYSCVLTSGTSTVTGTFSMTYVAAPTWTAPSSVYVDSVSVLSSGTGPAQVYTPYVTSLSSTGISGVIKSGTTLSVLGATVVAGTVAEPVTVKVCGW